MVKKKRVTKELIKSTLHLQNVGFKPLFGAVTFLPRWALKSIKLVIPFIFFFLILYLPFGIDPMVQKALAVFVCIALLWTLEGLPLTITSLLVPVLLVATGVFKVKEALTPFANPAVYLILGGLILAEAFRKSGLDRRLTLALMSKTRGNLRKVLLYVMIATAILSMWISNTATVALLIPVVIGIASQIKSEERVKITSMLLIGLGIAAAVGGMGTIVGSSPNAVSSAFLSELGEWTFLSWMKIGIPATILVLGLAYFILPLLFRIKKTKIDISTLIKQTKEEGKMSLIQKKVLAIFLGTVVFWVIGGKIGGYLGFPLDLTSAAMVSLSAVVILFVSNCLVWEDARSIAWEIMLIIGAGLALGEGLFASGAAEWIGNIFASFSTGYPVFLILIIISVVTIIFTNLVNNTATVAILIPILISMSTVMNVNPKLFTLVCAFSVSIAFLTPIATPAYTLIYGTGLINRKQMFKSGIFIVIPSIIIVIGLVYLLTSMGWI